MNHNIVLAGVGGQGILTIARGLSLAALEKGLNVKQAEVHGMSQRGGAVYANVRISSEEIFSDIIALGQADMILAVEPMEALRYTPYLAESGVFVVNTNAVTNIPNYPAIEQVLDAVAQHPNHLLIDMERLARAAGSPLAANVVAIGAASLYLNFSSADLENAIESMFRSKGDRIIQVNLKAFNLGRGAARAYLEALNRGATPRSARQWIETLTPDDLLAEVVDATPALDAEDISRLTGAEAYAFEGILRGAYDEGRAQLYEHEVYRLIELVGAISPPRHVFVPKDALLAKEVLDNFPGEKVVLKLVSPDVVHKSDVKAVAFVPNEFNAVQREMSLMIERHSRTAEVAGVLLVEFVESARPGIGSELFLGIRSTREFGPVIAAGLGGVETEFFAARLRQGQAVAKAIATEVSAEEFLDLFRQTAAYDLVAGNVRGHERAVSDGELIRCFRAFISIARHFCIDRGEEGPDIGELEVNPFAYRHQRLVPLDGLARLRTATKAPVERPIEKVSRLLEPKSIAVIGVSANSENFGRIILKNILRAGFNPQNITVIHERESTIDGVKCVPDLTHLPEVHDLLVIAAPNTSVPKIIDEANRSGLVQTGIIISAGFAEAEGAEDLTDQVQQAIFGGDSDDRVLFLGPNCMGVQSRPGKYDTFFIPEEKLGPVTDVPDSPVALVSQSGAFVISRVNHLAHMKPRFSITLGNQADISVSDILNALKIREDISVVGVYLEGFADLDGARFVRAVREATEAGKAVVFYKGGRSESGRAAAAGHTASLAGDYDICLAAMRSAGALVAENFQEFEQFLELATLFVQKESRSGRVFAITNAGMEAVALADSLATEGVPDLTLSPEFESRVQSVLEENKLGQLVSPRNPLDLTPMASERTYEAVLQAALDDPEIDALIVSCVPLTPNLRTADYELDQGESLADIIPRLAANTVKPIVFVLDAGSVYDAMADRIRKQGVPVFRTADAAGRALGRYLKIYARPSTRESERVPVLNE